MQRLFVGIGTFSVRYRWLVVAVWVIVTVISVGAFPGLNSVTKSGNSGFLPSSSPSIKAAHLAAPFQNSDYATLTLIVARSGGALTTQDQAAIDQVETTIRADAHVKTLNDTGISRDSAARQAMIQADVSARGGGTADTLVSTIRSQIKQASAASGLEMHLTGSLAQTIDANASTSSSEGATTNLTYLFIIVLLLLVFRSPLAPIVTLIPAAFAFLLSGPVITGLATHLNFSVSSIASLLLIVLVLGAGTDYALFLIYRMREELRRGLSVHDSVIKAVSTVGETIAFSGLTVIVALLSLLIAQFGFYQSLGPALAIGIFVMLLAGLTFLPALLAIFGRAVFWPISTKPVAVQPAGLWGQISARMLQRPVLTLIIGVVFFGSLALGRINTPSAGFGNSSSSSSSADSAVGSDLVNKHYPAPSGNITETLLHFDHPIWDNPASLSTAQQQLSAISSVKTVLGPLTPNGIPLTVDQLTQLHQILGAAQTLPPEEPGALQSQVPPALYNAYRGTAQYISADGHTLAFVTILKDGGSGTAEVNAVPALRSAVEKAGKAAGADQVGLSGANELSYDVNAISSSDLNHIIPLVTFLIAVLLAIVLRSLVAPLYLVVSVVLSYFAALGVAAIIFVRIAGQDGLNFVLPFLLFAFLMALGSDYNLLVMTRIREEAHFRPLRVAVKDAVSITSTTVTTAGLILAGTFAVLGFAGGGEQVQQIGFGVAAGILMDTFLIRTLLVPAIVVLLGRWNWWPSPLFHRSVLLEGQANTSVDDANQVVAVPAE